MEAENFKPQKGKELPPQEQEQQERYRSLEKLGKDIVHIGEEIQKHPPLRRLKRFIKQLGKDTVALLGIIKKEERDGEGGEVREKTSLQESQESHELREKLERALKTIAAYGVYTLALAGGKTFAQEKPVDSIQPSFTYEAGSFQEKEALLPKVIEVESVYPVYELVPYLDAIHKHLTDFERELLLEFLFDADEKDIEAYEEDPFQEPTEKQKDYVEFRDKIFFLLFQENGYKTVTEKLRISGENRDVDQIAKKKYLELKKKLDFIRMGTYAYYHESIFNDYQTFYENIKNDRSFILSLFLEYLKDQGVIPEKILPDDFETRKEIIPVLFEKLKKFDFDVAKILEFLEETGYLKQTFNHIKGIVEKAHEMKKHLITRYQSKAYRDRLQMNVGEQENVDELIEKMVENVKKDEIYISNFPHAAHGAKAVTVGDDKGNVYSVFAYKEKDDRVIEHELSHAADAGGKYIPQKTKEKLEENVSEKKFTEFMKYEKEYFRNPTEILARKAAFDTELEKLGIKKYEEEFTEEHYKKIKKLFEEGKLSPNSKEFFRMFEKDALIMIMNTIAYQDWKERGVPIDAGKVAEEMVAKILKVSEMNASGDTYYPPELFV